MSKTLVYEGAEKVETAQVDRLEYESDTDCWRFERTTGESVEIVRIPRERIYEIRQQARDQGKKGQDRYGHP